MRKLTAIISVGVTAGALASAAVTFAAASPAVSPGTPTGIGQAAATLHGTVNPNGEATTYQFDWGLTTSLGNVSPATPASAGAGSAAVAEAAKLTALAPATTYYYQLRASNAAGAATTPIESFKTTGNPAPTLTTDPAVNVSRYSTTLVGTVNPDAQATSYFFQYGLSSSYAYQTGSQTLAAGTAPVLVTAALAGIEPGTVFHYRLVSTHGANSTTYGADMTFQTAPFPRPRTRLAMRVGAQAANRLLVSGRMAPSAATPAAYGCHGAVRVAYLRGNRVLSTRLAPVGLGCTFASGIRLGRIPSGTYITVRAHYLGDLYNGPSNIRQNRVVLR